MTLSRPRAGESYKVSLPRREQKRYPLAGRVVEVLADTSDSTVTVRDNDERVFAIQVSWLREVDEGESNDPDVEPSSYWGTVAIRA
jgi:hypothetical protein